MKRFFTLFIFTLCYCQIISAQTVTPRANNWCMTMEIAAQLEMEDDGKKLPSCDACLNLTESCYHPTALNGAEDCAFDLPTCNWRLPMQYHVFTSGGNYPGNANIDALIAQEMAALNSIYNSIGVEFYNCASTNFIVDPNGADGIWDFDTDDELSTFPGPPSATAVTDDNDVAGVINVYLVDGFSNPGLCGYAFLPLGTDPRFNHMVYSYDTGGCGFGSANTSAHEIGHFLGLYHPHTDDDPNTAIDESLTQETPGAGGTSDPNQYCADCGFSNPTGDCIFDTNPDPLLSAGICVDSNDPSCNQPCITSVCSSCYVDACNGCNYSGPTGYNPNLDNIMNYNPWTTCSGLAFTQCQLAKMSDELNYCKGTTLNGCMPDPIDPTDPVAICSDAGLAALTNLVTTTTTGTPFSAECFTWWDVATGGSPISQGASFTPPLALDGSGCFTPGVYDFWVSNSNIFECGTVESNRQQFSVTITACGACVSTCPDIIDGTLALSGGITSACSGDMVEVCVDVDLANDPTAIVEFTNDAGTTWTNGALSPAASTTHTVTVNSASTPYNITAGPYTVGDVVNYPGSAVHPIEITGPSGVVATGNTNGSFTITEAGTYTFDCLNHPAMEISITVETQQFCTTFIETNTDTDCLANTATYQARFRVANLADNACDIDLQTTGNGSLSIDIYPAIQTPSETVSGCTNTITSTCGDTFGAAMSPTGGASIANWNSTTGVYTAQLNDAVGTIMITVNNGVAGTSCAEMFTIQTPECLPNCPTFTAAPTALSITAESVCAANCTPANGAWALAANACPAGSSLQLFANATTETGGTALTTAPTYNQTVSEEFNVRCVCDEDNTVVSPVQTISSTPGVCTPPAATTNDVAVCSGTTSETISLTETTGTSVNYSIDYNAAAEVAGFVDVASTAIAGASYTIPAAAVPGTYNGTLTYTDANGCSGTDAFTITVNGTPDIAPVANQVNTCPATTFDVASLTITDNNLVAGTTTTFHSAAPANATDNANVLASTVISSTQTVFVMVANATTACFDVASFDVTITTPCPACPAEPTAIADVTEICSGSTVELTLGFTTAGIAGLTGSFNLSSAPVGAIFAPVSPAAEGTVTVSFPTNTTCDAIDYVISIDAVCSDASDIANDPDNITVTVYPTYDASLLTIVAGDCTTAPSVTSTCANYIIIPAAGNITAAPNPGDSGANSYTITYTTGPNGTSCFSEAAQATYNCNIACPAVNTSISGTEAICSGSVPVLDATALVLDDETLAVNTGEVSWFTDAGLTIAYDDSALNHTGNDNCATESVTLFASVECVDDNSLIAAGSVVVTVYPAYDAGLLTIVAGDCATAPSVTSDCANYNITLDGDADDITTIPVAGDSGTNNYTITYNDGSGFASCFSEAAQATYNCPVVNIIYTQDLAGYDPCDCNNDQTANGAADGTFSETITIATNPATDDLSLCVANGAMPSILEGQMLTSIGGGLYEITFNHLDAIGYTLEIADCADLTTVLSIDAAPFTNTCYYPVIESTVPTTICNDATALDLNTLFAELMTNGDFMGNFTFSSTGTGVTGASFDPTLATIGMNDITATYTPTAVIGDNPGTIADCVTSLQVMIDVQDCTVPCTEEITYNVMAAGCDMTGSSIELQETNGITISSLPLGIDGGTGTFGVQSCGTYQVVIIGAPACYIDAGGDMNPRVFTTDGAGSENIIFSINQQDIPTLSEWGLILLALMLLSYGTIAMTATSGQLLTAKTVNIPNTNTILPFDKEILQLAFAITGIIVAVGFAGSLTLFGAVFISDIIGVTFAGPVFAYLIHLLILVQNNFKS